MHIIYKSIQTESFNCTLIRHDDKIKVFLNGPFSTLEVQSIGDFLVNMEPYWLQLISC